MKYPRCDRCPTKDCFQASSPEYRYCPMRVESTDMEELKSRYDKVPTRGRYDAAAKVEKESYREVEGAVIPIRPRIVEVVAFARELDLNKIGVAFCAGLIWEAERLCRFLETKDMDVASVMCKCLSIEKEEVGISRDHHIRGTPEIACNPVAQAALLNHAGTEINLIAGLCIGHDMIFIEHSEAPVTTIFVKDRMTGHNPVAPLYSSYFQEIMERE